MKTIKFYKQPNNYACGPFAILNVLKWCEEKVFLKDWKEIARVCETIKDLGTDDFKFEKTLYKFVKKILVIRRKVRFTTQELTNHLENGGIIILRISKDHQGIETHHYCLIIKTEPYKYVLVNYLKGEVYFSLSKKIIKKLEPYCVYYLKKRKRKLKC